MRRFGTTAFAGLFLLLILLGTGIAAEPTCPMCGSEMGAAKFTVTLDNGKEVPYACPRCAFMEAPLARVKAMKATDFLSRKTVDGRKATYLARTSYGECCPPYWLSFANREEAEKFAKGFGGQVLTYEEALKKVGK